MVTEKTIEKFKQYNRNHKKFIDYLEREYI